MGGPSSIQGMKSPSPFPQQIALDPENVMNNHWVVTMTPPPINMLLMLAIKLRTKIYWLAKLEFGVIWLDRIVYLRTFQGLAHPL